MYRFGKHPPKHDYRTLRFRDYLEAATSAPPPAYSALDRLPLGTALDKWFPMDANDRLGDCTIAALAHAVTVYRGLLGHKRVMGESAVVKLYMKLSGGIDSGLNMLDVVNYWRKHSEGGDKILAYAKLDPKHHDHVKQAIQLFGGVYLGFQCQADVLKDFDAKQPWTPGKLTQDGHAVYAVGYDPDHVTVLTWGSTQQGTWAWWDECVDEAYAILPPEAKDPHFAPGFDFAALEADLAAVAHLT